MPNRVVILEESRMASWDEFVSGHDAGSVYHTSAWRNVIKVVYGHEPLYFAILDDAGRILAGIPVFLVRSRLTGARLSTLPCSQSCNPLVRDESQYRELRRSIGEFMTEKGLKSWVLKTTEDFAMEHGDGSRKNDGYFTHLLRIDKPADEIFKTFHESSIQRAIRRAGKHELVLKRCGSMKEVEIFSRLYLRMRRTKGLLPQPGRFFEVLWETMNRDHRIEILFAEHAGQVISTIMLLKFKDTVTYEYGATENGAQQFSPSPLLLWEAIRSASAEGYKVFDSAERPHPRRASRASRAAGERRRSC